MQAIASIDVKNCPLFGEWLIKLFCNVAHIHIICSFLLIDQNNKLAKCDADNLHFNIPQISVCSVATQASVYTAK